MSDPVQVPLLAKLEQKRLMAQSEFAKRHEYAQKWLEDKGISLEQIREHSKRLLTGATLSSALLLSAPHLPLMGKSVTSHIRTFSSIQELLEQLKNLFSGKLDEETEIDINNTIKKYYGVSTVFELDNNRLPTYFGSMGLEQHLYRFATDTIDQHKNYQQAGLAPGRGAFGFFFDGRNSWSEAEKNEEYYIVLQTFIIPNWNTDWATLKDWYKFRKFLVINPQNGQAVVAVLGDSGPAVSTGKVFGGSPEVMADLGFYPKYTRGDVIVLFLDDPGNEIPLGPVKFVGGTTI